MRHFVRVRGRGQVEVPGYGIADAEHLVEKEMARLWPGAVTRIEGVSRVGPVRIVEEFLVDYSVTGTVEIEDLDAGERGAAAVRSRAFAAARQRLEGSRYARTRWELESQSRKSC